MKIPHVQSEPFLVGTVSMMDAILEIPMDEILQKMALDQETKAVLSETGKAEARLRLHAGTGSRQVAGWQRIE